PGVRRCGRGPWVAQRVTVLADTCNRAAAWLAVSQVGDAGMGSPPSGASRGGVADRWPAAAAQGRRLASGPGEVGGQAGGAGQAAGAAGAAGRTALTVGGPHGPVRVEVAGQLGPTDNAAGHHLWLGPAQALVQVQDDAAAHRRPPPRVA